MNRFYYQLATLLVASLFVTATAVFAQTVPFTASDFDPMLGTRTTNTTYTDSNPNGALVAGLTGTTGDGQIFDFTGFNYALDAAEFTFSTVSVDESMPLVGTELLVDPEYVTIGEEEDNDGFEGTAYGYYSINDDGLYFHGSVQIGDVDDDGTVDTVYAMSIPAQKNLALPLSHDTGEWVIEYQNKAVVDGMEVTIDFKTTSTADASGTCRFPGDIELDCVRINRVQETIVDGVPFPASRETEFMTPNGPSGRIAYNAVTSLVSAVSFRDATVMQNTANEQDELPTSARLDANYPNPFNPGTAIPFELEASSSIRLTVFDTLGREVAVLAEGVWPAGLHTLSFDAAGLPGGVYFYSLSTGELQQTRQMILLK